MKNILPVFVLFVLCGVSYAQEDSNFEAIEFKPITKLGDDIPTCSASDSKIDECIRQGFQQLMPRLKNGISELNIPPMDPFQLGKGSYNYNSGLIRGRILLRNVQIYGLSDSIVDKVTYRAKNKRVRLEILSHLPQMSADGSYKADITLNDMKLTPKGNFNITLTDVSMRTRALGELYERDGHTFVRMSKLEVAPKVGDMRIYANGLVPDPTLNNVILDFINQYWRDLYKAMLPETLATWEPQMLKVGNDFFAALPLDLLIVKD